MSVGRKLVSNSAYLFIDWFIGTLMGLIYWVMAGKLLLPKEYGIVSTAFNLAMILSGISALGLGQTMWKLIAEYLAKNRVGKVISLIRFSFKIIIISNLIILTVFLVFTNFISSVTNIPPTAVFYTGFMILAATLAQQTGLIMYGFQMMKKFLLTDLWGQLIKIVVSAAFLFLGFNYLGPMLGLISCFLAMAVLRFLNIRLKGKSENIDKRGIMMDYVLPSFVAFIAMTLFSSGQYVLLTALQNTAATGIYSVAAIFMMPVLIIPNTLSGALFPLASQLSAKRSTKVQLPNLIKLVFRYSVFVAIPIMLFLMVFSKFAILTFFRAEYLPASNLFPAIAIASLIFGLGSLLLNNLYAIGKIKVNRNIYIAVTIIFFTIAVPLIKMFSSFGLAVSYGISATLLFLLSYFHIKKHLKLKLPWKDTLKSVISGLIAVAVIYTLARFAEGLIVDALLFAFGGLIYLLLLIPFRFYKPEDIKILKFVSDRFPRFRKQINLLSKLISK